jgi:DNA modification methylase
MADTPLANLKPHPKNYNRHSDAQITRLMESLERFGQPKEIVTWQGFIIAGHGLVEAARRLGEKTLRARDMSMDWTETEALAFMAADNELARLGDPDEAALAQLVAGLGDIDAQLAALAAGTKERLKELLATLQDPPEDPGPQIDKAAELQSKWQTATGQLWKLGEHRLICGDCTDAAVVNAVAFGNRMDLWLTDAPYGVSYADKNKYLNAVAFGNRIQVPIENDHLTLEDASDLWGRAAKIALEVCADHAAYYWFACQGGDQMMMMMRLSEAGWKVRHELIWVKNNHVLGRSDYNYKHEPILYGWKQDGKHKFYGGFQTSILEFPKPQNSDLHPTMKPVELIERLILNSTETGHIVFDGFLGSGTTLIACQNLGRRCRAIEISPAYVAVALERWATMTGKTPELLDG